MPSVLQVICGKCSEFKAENGRQSRVCRQCFLTQPVATVSPSPEEPVEPKQGMEVGELHPKTQAAIPSRLSRRCSQGCRLPWAQD